MKTFSRSIRSLSTDSIRSVVIALFYISILLCIGVAWSIFARISLYEISETARLELYQAVYPLEAEISGKALAVYMVLGQNVQIGDVLVELDAKAERLQLQEEQARITALTKQLSALRDEIMVQENVRIEAQKTASLALEETHIQQRTAKAVAQFAGEEVERLKRLHEGGYLSDVNLRQTVSDAEQRRTAAEALRLAITKLEKEQQTVPLAIGEAQARYREAQAGVKFSQENMERLTNLHQKGALADADFQRSKAELQKQQESAEALKIAVSKLENEHQVSPITLEEAEARYHEADAIAKFSEREVERLTRLYAEMHPDQAVIRDAELEAKKQQATVDSLSYEILRIEQEQRVKDADRNAQIMKLKSEVSQIEGTITVASETIKRLSYEMERRIIHAPATGKLEGIADLRIGAFVHEGDKLGTIVSKGKIKAIAYFLPVSAIGRIQIGQSARMSFYGFPRTQYGTIPAKVTAISNEPKNGQVQVELDVNSDSNCPIPLQHGLQGTAEIEIGQVSPLNMLLRSAGKILFGDRKVINKETDK